MSLKVNALNEPGDVLAFGNGANGLALATGHKKAAPQPSLTTENVTNGSSWN